MFLKRSVNKFLLKRRYNEGIVQHINSQRHLVTRDYFEFEGDRLPYTQVANFEEKETPGLEPLLNWSLSRIRIHPTYECFGNPSLKELLKRCYGKLDRKLDNLHVQTFPTSSFDIFALKDSKYIYGNSVQDFPPKFAERIFKEVAYHLGEVPYSFVQDNSVGSSKTSSFSLRVMTDNSVTGLFLRNLLLRTSKSHNPFEYKYEGFILHAPGYQFQNPDLVEEFNGPTPKDLGLKKEEFVLLNENKKEIIISAISDTKVLLEAIATLCSKNLFEKGALLVDADTVIQQGEISLLFNSPFKNLSQLYSAHHTIWNKDGLSRAYGGVSFIADTNTTFEKGDLIEEEQNGELRVTRSLKGMRPNLIKQPHSIVFFIKDESFSVPSFAKLSIQDATDLFISGLIEVSDSTFIFSTSRFGTVSKLEQGKRFKEFLEVSKAKVYVVNSASSKITEHLETVYKLEQGNSWEGEYLDGKKGDLNKVLESIKTKVSK